MRRRGRGPGRFSGRASAEEKADSLKETIYVSFTLIAVLVVGSRHEADDPAGLALAVVVTTVALASTMLAAHVISHLVVHDRGLTGDEARHALRTALTPLGVAVAPAAILAGASRGWWPAAAALSIAVVATAAGLATVMWLAARGLTGSWMRRFLMASALVVVAVAVVAVQTLAHG